MGQKSALYNSTTGAIMGYYDSVDSPLPKTLPAGSGVGDITDSEWQSGLSSPYAPTVDSGVYTIPSGPPLAAAQTTQSGLVASACSAAESAPLAFTNAAGVSSSFPMDSGKLAKYLSIYTKYYVKELPFPNSATTYNFYDVNGKAVAMTLTDIENFFNSVEAQVDSALAKQETVLADIAAATTVTAVQTIVW
jgi:hypothetical protein